MAQTFGSTCRIGTQERENQSEIITDVEGDIVTYVSGGYYSMPGQGLGGIGWEHGMIKKICYAPDGKTVYMSNILPAYMLDSWVKGSIEDGIITIPTRQLVQKDYGGYDICLVTAVYDAMRKELTEVDNVQFKVSDDRRTVTQLLLHDLMDVYIAASNQDDMVGQVVYGLEMAEINAEGAVPPADAVMSDYKVTHLIYSWPSVQFASIAFSGEDVYVQGLAYNQIHNWVKGSLRDGDIVIPSGQFVGLAGNYTNYAYGARITAGGYDLVPCDEIVLEYDSQSNAYRLPEDMAVRIGISEDDTEFEEYGIVYHPYELKLEQPGRPSALKYMGDGCFQFLPDANDVNGELLNPDHLFFRIHVNGEAFTFATALYPDLEKDTTDLPFGFCAADMSWGNNGYMVEIPVRGVENIETFGVEEVYIVDGEECSSGIVSVDLTEEVEEVTASPAPGYVSSIPSVITLTFNNESYVAFDMYMKDPASITCDGGNPEPVELAYGKGLNQLDVLLDGPITGNGTYTLRIEPEAVILSDGESSDKAYEFVYIIGTDGVVSVADGHESSFNICRVDGTVVAEGADSLDRLPTGIYIVNGRKVVVR